MPGAKAATELVASGALDGLFAQIDAGDIELTGDGGFIPSLIKAALERGLQAELSEHLGYEKGDPLAAAFPNCRNGTTPKTVATEVGEVDLAVPRDRAGSFEPRLVPKGQRRLGGLDDMIVSLYAGGMTVRDIQHHLVSTIGTDLSPETISTITDEVLDEVLAWQRRPLEPLYPVVYLDALVVKVRDGAHVRNKAAHIAVGVDMDGVKHALGIWVQQTEGAKFWAGVCAELANRGVKDVLIVCCDGLTGFPEAVAATWPLTTVQTCLVHLIRAAMRFVQPRLPRTLPDGIRPAPRRPRPLGARRRRRLDRGEDVRRYRLDHRRQHGSRSAQRRPPHDPLLEGGLREAPVRTRRGRDEQGHPQSHRLAAHRLERRRRQPVPLALGRPRPRLRRIPAQKAMTRTVAAAASLRSCGATGGTGRDVPHIAAFGRIGSRPGPHGRGPLRTAS